MKQIIFFFVPLVFYKPILGQNTTYQDSSDTNCKFYQGELSRAIGDSATYIYYISKHNSFIEFTTLTFGSIITKYRLQKLSNNQIFTFTKTILNRYDSTSTGFIAIDSITFNQNKIGKRHFKNLKNENIFMEIPKKEFLIFDYFFGFITKHNLQTEFINFKPNLFVAWFKIKSK